MPGTGLSLYHGIYPYITSRDTTAAGCLAEAGISPGRVRKVIMVCRTYPIRVADPDAEGKTSGFMSQPLDWVEIARRAGLNVDQLRGPSVLLLQVGTAGWRNLIGSYYEKRPF